MKKVCLTGFSTVAAALMLLADGGPLAGHPWIGDGQPDRNGADWYEEDPAPEFRATFTLPDGFHEVKVHFACAGFGWFSVDGKALMRTDGLDTLWTPYDKTVYSRTFTVPVASGTHDIVVRLGNGFYNLPPLRFWGGKCFRTALAHGRPCFKLAVEGVEKPLAWRWRRTNVVRNSVYLGTEIDATRLGDTEWKPAAKVAGPKGTIRPWPLGDGPVWHESYDGEAKWMREGSVQVVDFGVNASGVPDFLFHGEAHGTRVEIVYGERLNADGSVNVLTQTAGQIKRPGMGGPGAPRVACQRDAYTCGGAASERFTPPFTWHIFRYAEIRGAKHLVQTAQRHVRSMVSLGECAPAAKAFKTNEPRLAAIHEMCQRTFQANLIGGVQSDCPGRERLGYGGDIVSTSEAMMLNWDMRAIYLKVLQDFADEAEGDGWITETAPYVGIGDRGFGGRSGPLSWALAVPELIDGLLRHYNETRALDYYPVCARYVRQVAAKCPTGIVTQCLGDHEALARPPRDLIATAHWYRFVSLTAGFAKRLGRADDAAEFGALAEKIKAAFVAKYVKDGIVGDGSQSAQATGLYLGLVPQDQVPAAEGRLLKAIEEKGYGPTTGIFSTRYMLMYLSEHGRVDVARKIVLHKGFPGWLHMLDRGATTLWETWKESDNVFSNCHPMFGSVDEWILRFGK